MNIRNILYKLLRISNDINAIKRGTIGKRVGRRVVRQVTRKGMRQLFK